MRWFTPEIEEGFAWFTWTHQLTETGWQRVALPRAGGLGEQPGRLMELLEVFRRTANQVLDERTKARQHARDVAAWRAERERTERARAAR